MISIILQYIPFVFFGIPVLVVFGLFISGAFTLFFTGEKERGKDVIAKALTYFLILLALFLVFVVVSYLVKQGAVFSPGEEKSEFPMSPMGGFPSSPDFVMVGDYSLSGPWPLPEVDVVDDTYIYGIFCKTDQGYDIIDLDVSYKRRPVSSSPKYQCWQDNCGSYENIYLGFYWTSPEEPYLDREYLTQIKKNINLICDLEK